MPAQEEALVSALAPVLKAAIARATQPLIERNDALETKLAELEGRLGNIPSPLKGEDGRDGKDADMDAIERRIEERFDALKKEIPAPEKGKDGRDGISIIEAMQDKSGELVLIFSDGKTKSVGVIQGKDGKDGKNGENANIEAIREIASSMTETKGFDAEALKALIPEPVKGKDGEKGPQGESAYQIAVKNGFHGSEREWLESLKGEKGDQGERGVDVANVRINKDGELVFEMSNDVDYNVGIVRGENGSDGKDADPVDYELIEAEVKRLVDDVAKSIPEPVNGKDGKDGKDGKSVDPQEVRDLIEREVETATKELKAPTLEPVSEETLKALVDAAFDAMPKPNDGESVTVEDVAPIIKQTVSEEVAKIERPKDGKDGRDGKDGENGKDGRGIETTHQNEKGELVIRFTDKEERIVGNVRGPKGQDGKDGRDGKDGLNFDDLRLEHDGERRVDFIFERGDDRKKSTVIFPVVIDRGPWSDGVTYERGDSITYGGCSWVATDTTNERPKGGGETKWRMAVRKGRDGRDAMPASPPKKSSKGS